MKSLANLESFRLSAENNSFSAAARLMGLTPAAVSRNVAALERNLGTRLLQRSTRKLTLTEAGERFLISIGGSLETLKAAIAEATNDSGAPAGRLKVSLSPTFGMNYILPLLPEFLSRYPAIRIDWQFDNRQVDLIAEGFDAAIGGGFELQPGIVARKLAPAHIVAVASPAYLGTRDIPKTPSDLAGHAGVVMRSARTGRIRQWTLLNARGEEAAAALPDTVAFNDPAALCEAALLGIGVALIALPDALPYLQAGRLKRVLPDWHADAGPISLYYATKELLPAKTRVFVEHLTEAFRRARHSERFNAYLASS